MTREEDITALNNEPQLVVFRPASRYLEMQARQVRNGALLLSTFSLVVYLAQLLTSLGSAHPQQRLPNPLVTGLVWFVLVIGPTLNARQTQRRNSRGRIALGREGILLLPPVLGATLSRRQVIPWGDVAAIGPSMGMFRGLAEGISLRPGSALLTGRRRRHPERPFVTLRHWQYEAVATRALLEPGMHVDQAVRWYWQQPERRAGLARLPEAGQEQAVPALAEPAATAAPVVRWTSLPAWASLGLLVGLLNLRIVYSAWVAALPDARRLQGIWSASRTTARSLFSLWIYPDQVGYSPYEAAVMALIAVGMALVLLRAGRRSRLFTLGAAALTLGLLLRSLNYELVGTGAYSDASLLPTVLQPDPGEWLYWTLLLGGSLLGLLASLRRRAQPEDTDLYVPLGALLLGVLAYFFAVTPLVQDAIVALCAPMPLAALEAVKDALAWPSLALLALALCYFQGSSRRTQRRATLGVLLCGLGMLVGAPGAYLAVDRWMATHGEIAFAPDRDPLLLGAYVGLHMLAGALVLAGAGVRLKRLARVAAPAAEGMAGTLQPVASGRAARGWSAELPAAPAPAQALGLSLAPHPPPPAAPPEPELSGPPRLIVFRRTTQARQFYDLALRRVLYLFGGLFVLMLVVMLVLAAASAASGHAGTMLAVFGLSAGMLLVMFPPMGFQVWLRRLRTRERGRQARIALGREGVLLTPGAALPGTDGRRVVIAWDAIARVQTDVREAGLLVAFYLRRGSRLRLGGWARASALLQGSAAHLLVLSDFFEPVAPEASPVAGMQLAEALEWFVQNPARRQILAPVPAAGTEAERAALALEPTAAPVMLWTGLPVWASLALFVGVTLARTAAEVWLAPSRERFTGYGVTMMALTCGGLALMLVRAWRRGWLFSLGGLALVAGTAMQLVTRVALDDHRYADATPVFGPSPIPLGPEVPGWFIYGWLAVMTAAAVWVVVAVVTAPGWLRLRHREPGPSAYSEQEVLGLVALLTTYALAPAGLDVLRLLLGVPPAQQLHLVGDMLLLPHLALLAIVLGYFHGASARTQQRTTLGVLACGVGMVLGMPTLYLLLGGWRPGQGWLEAGSALGWSLPGTYLGLYVVAGALVTAAAGVRLLLGPGEEEHPALDLAGTLGPDC